MVPTGRGRLTTPRLPTRPLQPAYRDEEMESEMEDPPFEEEGPEEDEQPLLESDVVEEELQYDLEDADAGWPEGDEREAALATPRRHPPAIRVGRGRNASTSRVQPRLPGRASASAARTRPTTSTCPAACLAFPYTTPRDSYL